MKKEGYQLALTVGLVALVALFAFNPQSLGQGHYQRYAGYSYNTGTVCNDGIDNDGDGQADWPRDDGCMSRRDISENQLGKECDDGLDNDGNGRIDYPSDAGCISINDRSENSNIQLGGCGDSDGGHKPNVAGIVYETNRFQTHPYYDRCYSNYAVTEYTCSQGKATFTTVRCTTGICRDGACAARPIQDLSLRR